MTSPPAGRDGRGLVVRIDEGWQALEARLCAGVLIAEIVSLVLWISLKGLSTDYAPGGNAAGLVYRGIAGAAVLGSLTHWRLGSRAKAPRRSLLVITGPVARAAVVSAAVVVGLAAGRLWAHAGVAWASNALNWLQNASVLMLVGGLRGLATRLTLWLALLGASLATSGGKHIRIDFAVRFVPRRLRAKVAVLGFLAAAAVCVAGVFGFVDYIAIAEYRADALAPCANDATRSCDAPLSEKLATVRRRVRSDLFLLGRQASLDARSIPHVIAGGPYDRWMTAREWNEWLDGADWSLHFGPAADALRMDPAPAGAVRMPQVSVPGSGEDARGLLSRELNFVFPIGLSVIAIKFILLALRTVLGHRARDDDANAVVT
jgi:Tripartite ATP-independent periplasmic transporters, DctQ component